MIIREETLFEKSLIKNKIIIAGGRHFTDYKIFDFYVAFLFNQLNLDFEECEIVSGNCEGVDKLGELFASNNHIKLSIFPAKWGLYGKSAGIKRNIEMLDYISSALNPIVIAFWDGVSKGTKFTIENAQKRGFKTYIFRYEKLFPEIRVFEGIRQGFNGDYIFDFDSDFDSDIVKLDVDKVGISRNNNNIYYYGYKLNTKANNSLQFKNLLKYLKGSNALEREDVQKFIDRCTENFVSEVDVSQFDYVIGAPSKSKIVSLLINGIKNNSGVKNIHSFILDKLSIDEISFDYDLLKSKFKGDNEYFNKLVNYLDSLLKSVSKSGSFSITKIPPKYRKYLKPYLKMPSGSCSDIVNSKQILLVDDFCTSGETFISMVKTLRDVGYTGDFVLFSLIKNY